MVRNVIDPPPPNQGSGASVAPPPFERTRRNIRMAAADQDVARIYSEVFVAGLTLNHGPDAAAKNAAIAVRSFITLLDEEITR